MSNSNAIGDVIGNLGFMADFEKSQDAAKIMRSDYYSYHVVRIVVTM